MILEILKNIGKSLITALLTEAMAKRLIIMLLEFMAKKTTNDVDNQIVEEVKKALYPEQK